MKKERSLDPLDPSGPVLAACIVFLAIFLFHSHFWLYILISAILFIAIFVAWLPFHEEVSAAMAVAFAISGLFDFMYRDIVWGTLWIVIALFVYISPRL